MSTSKNERDRILQMIESGQVTATQAARLLDTLEVERDVTRERSTERRRDCVIRIRTTSLNARTQKVYATAAIPVRLIKIAMRLGVRLIPQLNNAALEDLLHTIESGTTGRLLDLQDLEKNERLEIFVE